MCNDAPAPQSHPDAVFRWNTSGPITFRHRDGYAEVMMSPQQHSGFVAGALLGAAILSGLAMAQDTSTGPLENWRASELLGVVIYNQDNDKIGDISDLLVDHSGRVTNIVLKVGGFPGMRDHLVTVDFDKLRWTNAAPPDESTNAKAATNVDSNARTASDATPRKTLTTGQATTDKINWYPDHAVLNITRDQLAALPEFKY